MAPKKDTTTAVPDFGAFINEAREKKKNQTLAQQIFGNKGNGAGNRRASAPGAGNKKPIPGGSLASRVGIQKRSNSSARSSPRPSPGNVNAEWTHDLHTLNNPPSASSSSKPRPAPPRGPRSFNHNHSDRLRNALTTSNSSPNLSSQFNIVGSSRPSRPSNSNTTSKNSFSIKGTATGPFCIVAKNLAQGTTAADIESAMQPIGGVILSCVLIAERPRVICEVVFESREGAENVVETFHGQNADGNILDVYHKKGPISSAHKIASISSNTSNAPSSSSNYNNNQSTRSPDYDRNRGGDRYTPRNNSNNNDRRGREDIINGNQGLDDRMDTDDDNERRGGLYSDDLVDGRGRGGGGGGNGRGRGRYR